MNKINRCIRFEPVLIARCEAKAQAEQLTFSEWLRELARREVGLEKRRNGRAK